MSIGQLLGVQLESERQCGPSAVQLDSHCRLLAAERLSDVGDGPVGEVVQDDAGSLLDGQLTEGCV